MAYPFRKILIVTMLLLGAFVMITAQAGASKVIFPPATHSMVSFTSTATDGNTAAYSGSLSSRSPANSLLLSTTVDGLSSGWQPLDKLVSLSWNELEITGDQAFLSDLLNLPKYNETWAQFIARQARSDPVMPETAKIYVTHLAAYSSGMFYGACSLEMENKYCLVCHTSSQAGYLASGLYPNQQAFFIQLTSAPTVDCEDCHMQGNEKDNLLIRGVE
jgi:hypothetical protein